MDDEHFRMLLQCERQIEGEQDRIAEVEELFKRLYETFPELYEKVDRCTTVEWLNAKENIPPENTLLLVTVRAVSDGGDATEVAWRIGSHWISANNRLLDGIVTYWAHLPEPY